MTDKEIIIDGVDVAGCKYFNRFRSICHNKNLCCDCEKNWDCYFKQHARKTQECEELKKTVLTKCPNCNSEYLTSKGIELYEENKKLKKECEELKEENQKLEMQLCNDCGERDDYNIPCKMIRDLDYDLQKEIEENDRYLKALEEIEEELKEDIYCESQECGCDDSEECLRCTKNLILDIISKAKDGK